MQSCYEDRLRDGHFAMVRYTALLTELIPRLDSLLSIFSDHGS